MEPGWMTIGAFARATGLSPRALRSYDRLGLLSPARVDPDTRYRAYRADQVARGRAIRVLRELEMPLLEIRTLLASENGRLRDLLIEHQGGSPCARSSSSTCSPGCSDSSKGRRPSWST